MFHFPMLVVSCHLAWKFFLSIIFRNVYHKVTKIPLVKISCDANVSKFGPIGISSGIDVGFSNWGLELVNVSLLVLLTISKKKKIIIINILKINFFQIYNDKVNSYYICIS